ncbi:MAG: cytochrome C oxidase subunit II [Proteobacteria bacterium]|nr:cytochrome C oxidase subunit II [Pseudomonadota bacterium]
MNPNSWISKTRSRLSLFGQDMQIEHLEKNWLYVATAMIGFMVIILSIGAVFLHLNPPSHWETIDSASLHLGGEFAEDKLGVQPTELPDGIIQVKLVAARYGFFPREIVVPADKKIQFRMASLDVLHGAHIPMTNMSTMILPGHVSEVTTVFPKPGEYPLLCNEYCGMGHDHMWSKVTVLSQDDWAALKTGGKQP